MKKELRGGYTTGTCAAAASKAAVLTLLGHQIGPQVEVGLPDGTRLGMSLLFARDGRAAVRKDAGDDPDISHGASIEATVAWADDGDVAFRAGPGVGTVTRTGLSIPPGEPAINPVPRQMIQAAVREATDRPVVVTISIPGGVELAEKTFNPRLGILGGLSILGTSGRVRPYSCSAFRESLNCALKVAFSEGVLCPVLVPGNIGMKAARKNFPVGPTQVIELGNEWGVVIELCRQHPFESLMALGHPGKLAKLAAGAWDTHSSRSRSAVPVVTRVGRGLVGDRLPDDTTVEGLFAGLDPADRSLVGDRMALHVRRALSRRLRGTIEVGVVLVNLAGDILGSSGDLTPWL